MDKKELIRKIMNKVVGTGYFEAVEEMHELTRQCLSQREKGK